MNIYYSMYCIRCIINTVKCIRAYYALYCYLLLYADLYIVGQFVGSIL